MKFNLISRDQKDTNSWNHPIPKNKQQQKNIYGKIK